MVDWRVRVAAYGLALRNGRILLARISPSDADAGSWTLPGGGLHAGESPVEAMKREFAEETGLDASPRELVGVNSIVIPHTDRRSFHGIRIVYGVDAEGEPVAEVDGSTDLAAWIDVDDLPPVVGLVRWALSESRRTD